jgi:predicted transcriptional regulator
MTETVSEIIDTSPVLVIVTDIVSAYVSNNSLPPSELPALMQSVYSAIMDVPATAAPISEPEKLEPSVSIKKSVTEDYIVCLEDGLKFRSMKRHLTTKFQMTPEQYRRKWGLPDTYPMVAPAYATARSAMARASGLGAKGGKAQKKGAR